MTTRPSYAAMSRHASFEHEKLKLSDKSIRLFQVQKGSDGEPIRLRMTQFSSQRRPEYKAISYTWGSFANPKQILVNGMAFSLHQNLWHLLYHLRLREEVSFLWADALCINQFNLRERNFHVQLMGKIYEEAQTVIVWLGLPSPDRTEIRALDFIKELTAFRAKHSDQVLASTYLTSTLQHRWETLMRMCRHSYWSRTWVIQEFLFARDVELLCGKAFIQWCQFETLLIMFKADPVFLRHVTITDILQSRTTRLTLRRQAAQKSNLYALLREYSDSSCSERRDKIYGILGLAEDCCEDEDGSPRGMAADYEKHIVEVYFEALSCVRQSLPSLAVIPAAALLILRSLHITPEDLADFVRGQDAEALHTRMNQDTFSVEPRYLSPVAKVWPSWTSVRDLQLKLETYDWGQHIGYQVVRTTSNQLRSPVPRMRRNSSREIQTCLPPDFISNVVEAADQSSEMRKIANYPCGEDLLFDASYCCWHPGEQKMHDNADHRRPTAILEQHADSEAWRIGFACTNVQRGDFVIQFQGLDQAFIVRRTGYMWRLIGTSFMIKHIGLEHEPLDPICIASKWTSHCLGPQNEENICFRTDALSLAELLIKV